MRAVLQRVLEGWVVVNGQEVGRIGSGLLVLLGVGKGDSELDAAWMAEKIALLRVFEDEGGKMNQSLLDTHRAALLVSQFTLYADTRKGRRPSFGEACEPAEASRLYELCCSKLRERGIAVATGVFRADMKVGLVNDGPVTLWLDSRGP